MRPRKGCSSTTAGKNGSENQTHIGKAVTMGSLWNPENGIPSERHSWRLQRLGAQGAAKVHA
jgi:hypothetical protein